MKMFELVVLPTTSMLPPRPDTLSAPAPPMMESAPCRLPVTAVVAEPPNTASPRTAMTLREPEVPTMVSKPDALPVT